MNWFEEAFGSFAEISPVALVIVIAALIVGIAGIFVYRKKTADGKIVTKKEWTTREVTTAALLLAASFLLSFIKIFQMPQGGSITPASMLPVMAFAYIYGVKKGIIVGLCYSILQFIQEPIFLTPMQFVLDYIGAFSLLGLAGFAKKSIIPGIFYGIAARFVCQFISGIVFFGEYAPAGTPVWIYSLGYNGSVCGVECAVCVAVALIPVLAKTLNRAKAKADDMRTSAAVQNV